MGATRRCEQTAIAEGNPPLPGGAYHEAARHEAAAPRVTSWRAGSRALAVAAAAALSAAVARAAARQRASGHARALAAPVAPQAGGAGGAPGQAAAAGRGGARARLPLGAAAAAAAAACGAGAAGAAVARRRRAPRSRPACCPRGALGPAAEATPGRGRMETLPGGFAAYVTGAGTATRAVVVASDVFGIHTGRNKAICDELAAEGYIVVMPDFFRGAYPDEGASPAWWQKLLQAPGILAPLNTPWSEVEDVLQQGVLPYLEQQGCGAGRVGILGFCWGAWVVFKACGAFPERFACGASAHPSVSSMAARWGESEPDMLRAVQAPQLVLASRDEPGSWKPGGAAEAALASAGSSPGHVFKEFSSMSHGFVPRADLSDPAVASEVARAMDYIKGFLGRHVV